MKNYIGVQIVKAEPMMLDEFNEQMGSVFSLSEKSGYIVKNPDGYVSWCPKNVFEKAYQILDCEDFISDMQ